MKEKFCFDRCSAKCPLLSSAGSSWFRLTGLLMIEAAVLGGLHAQEPAGRFSSLLANSPFGVAKGVINTFSPPVEFRGYLKEDEQMLVSLHWSEKGQPPRSAWLKPGESSGSLQFRRVDEKSETAEVIFENRILHLPLKQAYVQLAKSEVEVRTEDERNERVSTDDQARLQAPAAEIRRRRAPPQQQLQPTEAADSEPRVNGP
jgi:hypothetical protein